MSLRKIQDAEVEGKRVLLRIDFNVSVEEGTAKETFKIKAAQESLDYLLAMNCKVALMTYFGRPEGKIVPELSLNQIRDDVEYILGAKTKFVSDCVGEEVKKAMDSLENGEVILLENTRFYPGEDKNDEELAKKMSDGFDLFINDSFSQSHRDQSSITGITKFLPSYAGFRLQKEVEEMERIKEKAISPAVAIIGGAKIETKLPVIKFFEEKFDYVLVGGKIANEAIDQKIQFSDKVTLPSDFTDDRLDIGQVTRDKFKEIIAQAATIVWNGPLGKFEEEKYAEGTYDILKAILLAKEMNKSYIAIGGGETLEALEKLKAMDKVSFVSTGGGAMLEYLGGGSMPGIEALLEPQACSPAETANLEDNSIK